MKRWAYILNQHVHATMIPNRIPNLGRNYNIYHDNATGSTGPRHPLDVAPLSA
jgi:hypothetical protein